MVVACLGLFIVLPGDGLADEPPMSGLQLRPPQQSAGQSSPQPSTIAELHDIRGPIELPEPVPYGLYLVITAALLAIGAGVWWWLRHRGPAPVAAIPPAVLARDGLMRARELMTPEQTLAYMTQVSAILRSYLELRFTLAATSQTTREFYQTLPNRMAELPVLTLYRDELQHCLEQCDLAKFAHQPASLADMQQMENSLLAFINTTEVPAAGASDQREGR
jgi:hypothetical protein